MIARHHEVELVLCCARVRVCDEGANRVRTLLRMDLDWDYLIETALLHGVLPLLYRSLDIICPEALPQSSLEQLRDYFHANEFHNRLLVDDLATLLMLFEAQGIDSIPFKGPALASSSYGDLSLRQFHDLDILICKQDILKAKYLLTSRGYQIELTGPMQDYFLKHRYHYHFTRDDGLVHIELHWAFTRKYWPFKFDFDQLWERAERVSLAGTQVRGFSPEDSLLVLCAHGAKHFWPRLLWICDIAELIRAHLDMDWDYLIEQARKLGSKRILFLGLYLANDLLGAVLPPGIELRVQADRTVRLLAAQIRERLFLDESASFRGVQAHIFYCRLRERLRDRVPYLLHHLFEYLNWAVTPNQRDRALLRLPGFLSFLYYLLRPLRLVRTYSSGKRKRDRCRERSI